MGVVMESIDELLDVLVDECVVRDLLLPLRRLLRGWQLSMDEQVRGFQVGAVFGELLDRVAAVQQDPAIAVDIRDGTLAGRGVHECRVVDEQPVVVAA